MVNLVAYIVNSPYSMVNQVDHLGVLMTVSTRSDAQRFDVDEYAFYPLAVPSRGSKELAVWTVDANAGAVSPAHHHDREVVFAITSGRMAAKVGELDVEAGPGDAIIVPANTTFELRNASADTPASMTVIATAGMQATMGGNTFSPPWTL
jgi:mannose-6-phosphate isomerase-like protein (cupin superfamily)